MDEDATRIVVGQRASDIELDLRVHCLELVNGETPVRRRYVVPPGGAVIGRREPADIVLQDSELSRAHCRLTLNWAELVVTDLGSTNGTYVDGVRAEGPTPVPVGALLHVGNQVLKHEWRTRRELQQAEELDRDLEKALAYVRALLPDPIAEGPIRAEWRYLPSAKLGGDAFGYGPLGEHLFAFYLIDVSGHGAGAALHSTAILNVLRQHALPGVDMARPGEVLQALNEMFQMERHAGMYFTMWYGVFDTRTRRLEFASAGHHPAFVVPADHSAATGLRTRNPMIGAIPGRTYQTDAADIPPGASIYLFSDGVYEIVTIDGLQWGLQDFIPLILKPSVGDLPECERLFREVTAAARPGGLDDDFTLVVLTFE